MALTEIIMPKMGESIMEATILNWVKNIGDEVDEDETIVEIATDKVDSEIPSPVKGILTEIKAAENEVVEVGKVIAVVSTKKDSTIPVAHEGNGHTSELNPPPTRAEKKLHTTEPATSSVPRPSVAKDTTLRPSQTDRFYSPLVRNIAIKEGIRKEELDQINGTGMGGRVTKSDILNYIKAGKSSAQTQKSEHKLPPKKALEAKPKQTPTVQIEEVTQHDGNVEIIQMDRMRKLIADHMIKSKQTSAHVTSFIEVDVTDIVMWRSRVKEDFLNIYNEKITYTPIFIDAIVKAIKDFPKINCSVDGDKILIKKDIHIGMATALPSGNLIVPVIHNADFLNLIGLTKSVNSLAQKARTNQLKPEEIQGGTFTITNVGTFGNVMGTPIINQPQVAILATGTIRKKPAVVESEFGDTIAIRHMMFLSLSYDHRIVDGYLGGSFLRKVGDYLEKFDVHQKI